jgi:hypothetical protein
MTREQGIGEILDNQGGGTGGATAIDDLTDVDTSTVAPTTNDTLKYNGSQWVPAPYNYSFVFSLGSFVDNQTDTQLIGSGVWKNTGDISFTMSYVNGPPTSGTVSSASWSSPVTLTTPFTSASSTENTNYPATKDSTITFSLSATKGATTVTDTEVVTFRNLVRWGISSEASGWDSTDINALSGSTLSNSPSQSQTVNASSGEYLIFAYPSSYSNINATGFIFNSVTCPFESAATVSVTNSANFMENYKVYRSTNANLGNSTLVTSTTSNLINKIYCGVVTKTSGYTESDVEALANSYVSNTKGRTVNLTVDDTYYVIYALPVRLGTVTFTVNGFTGGFLSPETVSITNVNGHSENYYVYRSTNEGLGVTTLVVA